MIILSIETSCDETAVSIVRTDGDFPHATYTVLGNALFSQIDIHREYGGVFPALAKREHAKALVPMLAKALSDAGLITQNISPRAGTYSSELIKILEREPGLSESLIEFLSTHTVEGIDAIAVTNGPGLEPALWVGINFARALGTVLGVPVIPVNHMEGHVLSSIFTESRLPDIQFPAIALLISGGHTELVLMRTWSEYSCIGATRDDAVGEAFDKVARMLGLPYPGGPEISARAKNAREKHIPLSVKLPRPMIEHDTLDFSFSGLKTAVRYAIQERILSEDERCAVSCEFEDSVTEVLLAKTTRAIDTYSIQTLIVGGGVSANTHIRETFIETLKKTHPELAVYFPPQNLSTDNSIMIALAGHARLESGLAKDALTTLVADGNLSLAPRE